MQTPHQPKVKLMVRYTDAKKGQHNVTLYELLDTPLSEICVRLAKVCEIKSSAIALSLQGRPLVDMELSLRQAYGPAASFLIPLDATDVATPAPITTGSIGTEKSASPVSQPARTLSPRGLTTRRCFNTQGFAYVLEKPVDDDLTCVVCHEPLVDPLCEPVCGQMFCRACVCAWLGRYDSCPYCRGATTLSALTIPPRVILTKLNALLVACPECAGHFARNELAAHLPKCPIACKLGCGKKVAPLDEAAHDFVCVAQVVACPAADVGCVTRLPRSQLAGHTQSCPLLPTRPLLLRLQALEEKLARMEDAARGLPPLPRPPAAGPTPPPPPAAGPTATALYDYNSPLAGDLSFRKGEVIAISDRSGNWWSGQIGSRSGKLPKNYVALN